MVFNRVYRLKIQGVMLVDNILQEFNFLFLTRFRTYKIDTPPQTKTPVKTTFRDWCLYSSFVHGLGGSAALAGARHGEHHQGAGEARPEEPPPRPHRLRQ